MKIERRIGKKIIVYFGIFFDKVGKDFQYKYGIIFVWEKLLGFYRLIFIKILRFDALMIVIRQFVEEYLGYNFIFIGFFDLKEIYDDFIVKIFFIFIFLLGMYVLWFEFVS